MSLYSGILSKVFGNILKKAILGMMSSKIALQFEGRARLREKSVGMFCSFTGRALQMKFYVQIKS